MVKEMIFGTVGGLGLFLFGMSFMSDGLKRVAGARLKNILGSLTKHRVVAMLVGALTTCVIQSSSATTVMTLGFVNAGLLSLRQALCVVLGANVGTTFTAWLVSTFGIGGLKITAYSLPAVGVGFLLRVVGKTQKVRSFGNILLGFGLLFMGISFMKEAFEPLKNSAEVQDALIRLGGNPIVAILAGVVIAMLIQSSSAAIMMVQVLAFQGAFGTDWELVLRIAIPFVLGANIGTTITAQIAALQTSRDSRRVAMGHTMVNVIDMLYMLPLVWTGLLVKVVSWITPWALSQSTIMVHIAVAHSMVNVVDAILFLPIIRWLEAVVVRIIPLREEELAEKPVVLERHLLNTPVIAMDQARREIVRMAKRGEKAVQQAVEGLIEGDRGKLDKVMQAEELIDEFQHEITSYLVSLSRKELSDELSAELPVLLHTVNDLERVGDHAVNIAELAERKIEQKLSFSNYAQEEAAQLKSETNEMFDYISTALENNDTNAAKSALVNEENLNRMQIDFRRTHVQRMSEGICSLQAGLIFIDLVDNMEKIGDHLTNIAQSVIGGLQWNGAEAKSP